MCLLLIAYKSHPEYKLIVAANRDEFYRRPTEPAKFWNDNPTLLAGKDLECGGTWLGITKSGRFAAITNYRDIKNIKPNAPTRGHLVSDFLLSEISPKNYSLKLLEMADNFNGYNLIYGLINELHYFSNQTKKDEILTPGIYGLSNALLDTPWWKVIKSKKLFNEQVSSSKIDTDKLFDILKNKEVAKDKDLPQTGLDLPTERAVSPIFISSEKYGTRASTVLLWNKNDKISLIEKSLEIQSGNWETNDFNFKLNN